MPIRDKPGSGNRLRITTLRDLRLRSSLRHDYGELNKKFH
jgi:hypothetical protein